MSERGRIAAAKPRAASERRRNGSPLSSARRSGTPAAANRCSSDGGDGRAAARRDDPVPREVGDVDVRSRRGAAGGEGGDDLLVGSVARRRTRRGPRRRAGRTRRRARRRRGSRNMSAAMPSRRPTSIPGCAWLKRASSPGTSMSPAGRSAPIQIRPRSDAAKLVDLLRGGVDFREDAAGARGDRRPASVGRHAAARALEQRRAQLLLEPPDLVRERRLGEVELLGGAGEVPVARHRLHASELPELHANDRRTRSLG